MLPSHTPAPPQASTFPWYCVVTRCVHPHPLSLMLPRARLTLAPSGGRCQGTCRQTQTNQFSPQEEPAVCSPLPPSFSLLLPTVLRLTNPSACTTKSPQSPTTTSRSPSSGSPRRCHHPQYFPAIFVTLSMKLVGDPNLEFAEEVALKPAEVCMA